MAHCDIVVFIVSTLGDFTRLVATLTGLTNGTLKMTTLQAMPDFSKEFQHKAVAAAVLSQIQNGREVVIAKSYRRTRKNI